MIRKIYPVFVLSVVACGVTFSEVANSNCRPSLGGELEVVAMFPPLASIDPAAPVNSVLATTSISSSAVMPIVCYADETLDVTSVVDSGIPGIALRLTVNGNETPYSYNVSMGYHDVFWGEVTLELIKVGEITTGGEIFPPLGELANLASDTFIVLQLLSLVTPLKVVLDHPTCAVSNLNVPVSMGQVDLDELIDTGRSKPESLSIDLTCSGGGVGSTVDVYVTLTDQSNPGNRSTQLGLSPGSTATGVVVEVRNKNGLVNFGADSTDPGNPGQWFEGAAASGGFSIPLSANYLKVIPEPTPGTANAVATYTLSYQ